MLKHLELTTSAFLHQVHTVLSPSSPIRKPEYLRGRAKALHDIEVALFAKGRHVLITGETGVGKTSLAHTAAGLIQTPQNGFVKISCDESSTLEGVVRLVFNLSVLKVGNEQSQYKAAKPELPDVIGPFSAAVALSSLMHWHSDTPVIVLDGFEFVSVEQRKLFALMLKFLGDMSTGVKLIFVGTDMPVFIANQLETITLEPLVWDAREKIIDTAFDRFAIKVPEDISYQIAELSNGFPYYIHLMCEQLLVAVYDADEPLSEVNHSLYKQVLS